MKNRSRVGLWEFAYATHKGPRAVYGDPLTVQKAGDFLRVSDIETVEDWGCGLGGLKPFLGHWQQYIGLDGSHSDFVDRIVDLEHYASEVDAVHMRHVLEHNLGWKDILINALKSFQKRMVLTLFTPWAESTGVIAEYANFLGTGATMIDIGFRRDDIVSCFDNISWQSEENLRTESQYGIEHLFFLQR